MVSDAQLFLEFITTRCPQTFARLCAMHLHFLQDECRQLLHGKFGGEVEDAVQMVLVTFWQKADRVDPYKQRAWLRSAARKICAHIREHGFVNQRHLDALRANLENQHRAVADNPPAPCAAEIAVKAALAQLTKRQRQAVTLHHMEGKSVEDVAIDMRLSEGGVKYHLRLGLKRLRQILKELGIFGAVLLLGLRRLGLPLRRVAFGLSPKAVAAGAITVALAAGVTTFSMQGASHRPQLIAAATVPMPPPAVQVAAQPPVPSAPEPPPPAETYRRWPTQVNGAGLQVLLDLENRKIEVFGGLPIEADWASLLKAGIEPKKEIFMTIEPGTQLDQVRQILSRAAPPGTLRAVVEKDRIRIEKNPDPDRADVK